LVPVHAAVDECRERADVASQRATQNGRLETAEADAVDAPQDLCQHGPAVWVGSGISRKRVLGQAQARYSPGDVPTHCPGVDGRGDVSAAGFIPAGDGPSPLRPQQAVAEAEHPRHQTGKPGACEVGVVAQPTPSDAFRRDVLYDRCRSAKSAGWGWLSYHAYLAGTR